MNKNVIILPKISDQNLLSKYYSLADIFVICSKKENFPTTCIEAQCCGTPVVGFDTGGTKETSVYSEEYFVQYGDLYSLKERIEDTLLKSFPDLSEKAIKVYSKESMGRKYIEEYSRCGPKERILLIDVNCKYSSTGKIVYDLYKNIRSDGGEAAICYGRGPLIKEDNIYKFGIDFETYIHAALSRLTGYNGCFSEFSTNRLIRYIEKYKPDIIHIHELHAYFVNIYKLINYIKQKNIPVVWTFHCEYMYTGKCGHAYDCTNFEKSCGNCPAVREYPQSIWFDKTKHMLDMKKKLLQDWDFSIVTPSQWLADRVKMSFLKDKHIGVIHNGIDTSIFKPIDSSDIRIKLGIPQDNKIILAVAPNIMDEIKGGQWILKLAEIMDNKKLTFIMIGK